MFFQRKQEIYNPAYYRVSAPKLFMLQIQSDSMDAYRAIEGGSNGVVGVKAFFRRHFKFWSMMEPDDARCTAVKAKTVTLLILCSLAFAIGGSMWFTAIGFLDEVCESTVTLLCRNRHGTTPHSASEGMLRRLWSW